jgi:hypothetical protein
MSLRRGALLSNRESDLRRNVICRRPRLRILFDRPPATSSSFDDKKPVSFGGSGPVHVIVPGAGNDHPQSRRSPAMFDSHRSRFTLALVAALALAGGVPAVHAEMMKMKATLTGASEVPPNDSKGQGQATFDYDSATRKLTWNVTYSGLSGPATAGHIHGPAAAGANAGVVVPFSKPDSPITGSATLTDAQAADLMAGRMYVNVHTKAHPGGEIRGQIGK